jgi:glycerophosphoryl diester phosphodiesterase
MRVADLLEDLPPAVGVDIDLKSSLEDAVRPPERTTAGLVGALAARERDRRPLLVTSFDPGALLAVRALAPGVPLGWLTWLWFPLRKAIAGAASLGLEVVAPHVESFPLRHTADPPVEPEIAVSVAVAHRAGLEVLTWCPSEADAAVLDAAGVDGFVIDDVPAWRYAHPGAAETRQERLA